MERDLISNEGDFDYENNHVTRTKTGFSKSLYVRRIS